MTGQVTMNAIEKTLIVVTVVVMVVLVVSAVVMVAVREGLI